MRATCKPGWGSIGKIEIRPYRKRPGHHRYCGFAREIPVVCSRVFFNYADQFTAILYITGKNPEDDMHNNE